MNAPRLRELDGEDPYEVLGVPSTAGEDEILAAYRRQVRHLHPDLPTGSEQATKLLHIARAILLDPQRRAEYDASVADEGYGDVDDVASAWDSEDVVCGAPGPSAPPPMGSSYSPGYWTPRPIHAQFWGPEEHRVAWDGACGLLRYLVEGNSLQQLPDAVPSPGPGEPVFVDIPLEYARFYGVNVPYTRSSVLPIGSIPFIVGALAVNAIGNAVARSRAQAMASAQWREVQFAQVVLTNQRLLVATQSGWLSFYFNGIVDFRPFPDIYTLVLDFDNSVPLRLRGPAVPWISVALAGQLFPTERLPYIPGFAPLASRLSLA